MAPFMSSFRQEFHFSFLFSSPRPAHPNLVPLPFSQFHIRLFFPTRSPRDIFPAISPSLKGKNPRPSFSITVLVNAKAQARSLPDPSSQRDGAISVPEEGIKKQVYSKAINLGLCLTHVQGLARQRETKKRQGFTTKGNG